MADGTKSDLTPEQMAARIAELETRIAKGGEDTIRTLKHAKQQLRNHGHGSGAAGIDLVRGSAMCPSDNRRLN